MVAFIAWILPLETLLAVIPVGSEVRFPRGDASRRGLEPPRGGRDRSSKRVRASLRQLPDPTNHNPNPEDARAPQANPGLSPQGRRRTGRDGMEETGNKNATTPWERTASRNKDHPLHGQTWKEGRAGVKRRGIRTRVPHGKYNRGEPGASCKSGENVVGVRKRFPDE
ncbi:hypothetical protein B0T11DRAFT_115533 [Plectosphaerella cucumerina]|uniref:Secreted protein n=1 Tax=Plectosphaerella cucumerina TaxID=40658 RepID=A0A8K0X449_9PEZI|nr:hypothetical protein B0T11DRAFT_115533 [Plectosphaerella cucumerina]